MTLYDAGLQPERTELAWRRTALAIAVGSLVSMRVLPVMMGSALWIIVGVLGLIGSALLWVASRARYRAVYRAVHSADDVAQLPDARLLISCTVFTIAVGAVALFAVLWSASGR